MHSLHIACTVFAWLLAGTWIAKYIEASRGLPKVPCLLDPIFDANPEGTPAIAVIVPARNEASHVSACIQLLLAQDYSRLSIVAVDDRSTDGTGGLLDALAANVPADRLQVLHIRELPPDWLGKTHAMAVAVQLVIDTCKPDYLLFTDADINFAPDAIRRSLVAATRDRADHLVTLPTTIAKSWGEASILAVLQVMAMWAARSWRVSDPKAKRDAIGVGAFNMLRTEVYLKMGGFEALRMEVLEDLTLGRLVKQAGYRQRVAVAPGLISVHWARGMTGIVRGLTKNFFTVFDYRPAFVLMATVGAIALYVTPAVLLAVPGARLPALLAWAAAAGVYRLSSDISRLSAWWAISMPVAATVVAYAMMRSALITLIHGGVTWRDTFYPLEELRRHRAGRKNSAGHPPFTGE